MIELQAFTTYFKRCTEDEQATIVNGLIKLMQKNVTTQLMSATVSEKNQVSCPHCHSHSIQANGKVKGVQRFKCKDCAKYFSETTGTPLAWLKKKGKWIKYLHCMLMGFSLRECASETGIALQTSFDWRHKVLSAFKTASAETFTGILESDDIFFLHSEKGNKSLDRPGRKRGAKAKKAGIHDEHVAVIVSTDRQGNKDIKIATHGRISKADLEKVFEDKIQPETTICTDSHRSYTAFAKSKSLKHQKIKANKGQYVKDKVFHVQNVNNTVKRLRDWIRSFNGVSTKYLQNYLNWFMVLEKLKESTAKISMLVAFAMSTNQAWFDYKNIAINHILFRT